MSGSDEESALRLKPGTGEEDRDAGGECGRVWGKGAERFPSNSRLLSSSSRVHLRFLSLPDDEGMLFCGGGPVWRIVRGGWW